MSKLIEKEVIKEFEKLFLKLRLKPDEVRTGVHNYLLFYQTAACDWYKDCKVEINFCVNDPDGIEVYWHKPQEEVKIFKINDPNAFDKTIDHILSILSCWPRWQRSVIPIRRKRIEAKYK